MSTPQVPEQAPARPSARGRRTPPKPPRLGFGPHPWIEGQEECWCPLPRDNRMHQVDPERDELSARILGEREDDDR